MRILFSLVAVPAALLLSAGAAAQSTSYPATSDSSIPTVQVSAPYRIAYWQAEQVSGTYGMSNGWRLKVKPVSNGLLARIDNERAIRMVPVSADRFVSNDGNVTMDFNRGPTGDDMVMTYVPDSRVAIAYVVTATLAQR